MAAAIPTLLAFYPVIGDKAGDGIAGGPMDLRVLGQPVEALFPRKRRWAVEYKTHRKEAKWRRRQKKHLFSFGLR